MSMLAQVVSNAGAPTSLLFPFFEPTPNQNAMGWQVQTRSAIWIVCEPLPPHGSRYVGGGAAKSASRVATGEPALPISLPSA